MISVKYMKKLMEKKSPEETNEIKEKLNEIVGHIDPLMIDILSAFDSNGVKGDFLRVMIHCNFLGSMYNNIAKTVSKDPTNEEIDNRLKIMYGLSLSLFGDSGTFLEKDFTELLVISLVQSAYLHNKQFVLNVDKMDMLRMQDLQIYDICDSIVAIKHNIYDNFVHVENFRKMMSNSIKNDENLSNDTNPVSEEIEPKESKTENV